VQHYQSEILGLLGGNYHTDTSAAERFVGGLQQRSEAGEVRCRPVYARQPSCMFPSVYFCVSSSLECTG